MGNWSHVHGLNDWSDLRILWTCNVQCTYLSIVWAGVITKHEGRFNDSADGVAEQNQYHLLDGEEDDVANEILCQFPQRKALFLFRSQLGPYNEQLFIIIQVNRIGRSSREAAQRKTV